MRTGVRALAAAVAIGGLYALGALLPFWYLQAPAAGAPFFPPAGITVAALLLTRRQTWWLWLLAVGIAEISVDLGHHQTIFMALGFATANVVEPLVGASLMIYVSRRRRAAARAGWRGLVVAFVVCAVVAGPFVGGAIGGAVSAIAGAGSFSSTAAKWWLGDALGVLVVAFPILAYARRAAYPSPASDAEIAGIALVALAVVLLPPLGWNVSIAYAVLPVLMWAGLRGGVFGVGLSGLGVAFGANWLVASGRADTLFTVKGANHVLVDLQLFIAVTLLSALAFAVEVGERMRAERVLRHTEAERARQEVEALTVAAGERREMARDVHDIVGHALNVMILSAGGARRLLTRDPREAEELLQGAEDVGRDAFRDLDVALALVDQSPGRRDRGLGDLSELVERLAGAGVDVELTVEGTARALPRVVDWSAYRIVQESLTNVAKHAADAHASIRIRYDDRSVRLTITDSGGAPTPGNGNGARNGGRARNGREARDGRDGRGLLGMRERVALLGGHMEVGRASGGGYVVSAELPT
jgi:signal transduction histidine kinase